MSAAIDGGVVPRPLFRQALSFASKKFFTKTYEVCLGERWRENGAKTNAEFGKIANVIMDRLGIGDSAKAWHAGPAEAHSGKFRFVYGREVLELSLHSDEDEWVLWCVRVPDFAKSMTYFRQAMFGLLDERIGGSFHREQAFKPHFYYRSQNAQRVIQAQKTQKENETDPNNFGKHSSGESFRRTELARQQAAGALESLFGRNS